MPQFSVIVATYNRAHLISYALDSVFAQGYADYEVIVIDDGSTDDTEAVLQVYQGRIKLLQQKNQGPSVARNYGLAQATGEYITFLDSDDRLFPWALETYQQAIERFDRPAFLLGSMVKFKDEGDLQHVTEEPLSATLWDDYLQSATAGYAVAIPGAFRHEVLQRAGGFAEENICSEGHDLYLRIGTAKGFAMVHAPAVYAYLQHSITQSRNTEPLYRGARLLLNRERAGDYPGGKARRTEQSLFIARSLRYSIRRCHELGQPQRSLDLYLRGLTHYYKAGLQREARQDGLVIFRRLKGAAGRWVKRRLGAAPAKH